MIKIITLDINYGKFTIDIYKIAIATIVSILFRYSIHSKECNIDFTIYDIIIARVQSEESISIDGFMHCIIKYTDIDDLILKYTAITRILHTL